MRNAAEANCKIIRRERALIRVEGGKVERAKTMSREGTFQTKKPLSGRK